MTLFMDKITKWLYQYRKTMLFTIIPLFIFIINFFLKFRHLSSCPISGDEPFSIFASQMDIGSIIKVMSQGNNPPLFEIILHYWTKVLGIGPKAVRFLPCVFSCLTAVMVYKIGLKFFSARIALLSAILFTLSNYHVYFAHETRVYSLFVLLTSVSFYAYMNLLQSEALKYRLTHVIMLILIPYGHYLGFFVLIIQTLLTLFIPEIRQKLFRTFSINLLIALVFYIPFVPVFVHRFYDSTVYGTWLEPVRNLGQLHDAVKILLNDNVTCFVIFLLITCFVLWKYTNTIDAKPILKYTFVVFSIFCLFYSLSVMMPMPQFYKFSALPLAMASYIVMLSLLVGYVCCTSKFSVYIRILTAWFAFPLLVMFVSSFWVPMFLDRYLIYFTSAFYLLAAIVVSYLDEPKLPAITLLLVSLMALTFTSNPDKKRNVTDVVDKVKELKTDKTLVFICPNYFDLNFAYYYNRSLVSNIDPDDMSKNLRRELAKENIYPVSNYKQMDTLRIKQSEKVIYIDAAADFCYPGNKVKTFLDSCMSPEKDNFFYEIFHVIEYKHKR